MTFTKEQLQHIIETDHVQCGDASALARMALAGMEAEPVAWAHRLINKRNGVVHSWVYGSAEACPSEGDIFNIEVMPLYTAPPAPVSVPDEVTAEDCPAFVKYDVTDADEAWARGFNACRNAMLQGADRPQNEPQNIPENIPATQFKPVADLYGLTSPTGGETSFTFDAVEARDFIDGGWSCQEYVELERFQEAVSGNSPVIPGCSCLTCRPLTFSDSRFVVCPECGNKRCPHANDHRNACTGSNEPGQDGSAYPAAPQQEA
ncbi:hypothetical protein [Enterobacter kobei]|uniref:hypothetical protein n=1 Tax=Enterobacter kobei TaxID=208224 RepID=UPI003D6F355A